MDLLSNGVCFSDGSVGEGYVQSHGGPLVLQEGLQEMVGVENNGM